MSPRGGRLAADGGERTPHARALRAAQPKRALVARPSGIQQVVVRLALACKHFHGARASRLVGRTRARTCEALLNLQEVTLLNVAEKLLFTCLSQHSVPIAP